MNIRKFLTMNLFCLLTAAISAQNNPLLETYQTPFATVPFDKIKTEDYLPALDEAMAKGRKEIEIIANQKAAPTFENTILALENAGRDLGRISKIMFNMNSMETSPELQKTVKLASPKLTEYRNDISLNATLFKRVEEVYNQRAQLKLDPESDMLLEKSYKGFVRNGAKLSEDDKEKLRTINKRQSELGLKFGENVLNETNQFAKYVTDENELTGLPDYVKQSAAEAAKKDGKEGWKFTVQAPSYIPLMQYAENRELRKEMYMAFNSRAFKDNENNNREIIAEIASLRHQKANLLGYATWADYVLEERMADSKKVVMDFLDELKEAALPVAEAEMKELTAYAKKQGFEGEKLEKWDASFYAERLKKEKFAINDEILKPYFSLDNTLQGLFDLSKKLWGITVKRNKEIPVWSPEVMAYEIYDKDGSLLAIWYGDYFPRSGKRPGAWNNTLQDQWVENGTEYRPHVVNVCNFSRPVGDQPALLTFNEVKTLYHEFGHALHNIFADGKYASLTGTNVSWDFVELPSQLMENFVSEPVVLNTFAKHYETGELIPAELVSKIKESATFMSGMATLRQLSFGYLDMMYHGNDPKDLTIEEAEMKSELTRNFYPEIKGTSFSSSFSHIFAGGYSSGYYSYKWSEVLDADAYDMFKQNGVINSAVAQHFRDHILSKGGSQHPMELYKNFRGREPKPEAMLVRSGLITLP